MRVLPQGIEFSRQQLVEIWLRSEEHTSELQSPCNLVCRLLLEKKKIKQAAIAYPSTKIRFNATCRKCPHNIHHIHIQTHISCSTRRPTNLHIAYRLTLSIQLKH